MTTIIISPSVNALDVSLDWLLVGPSGTDTAEGHGDSWDFHESHVIPMPIRARKWIGKGDIFTGSEGHFQLLPMTCKYLFMTLQLMYGTRLFFSFNHA